MIISIRSFPLIISISCIIFFSSIASSGVAGPYDDLETSIIWGKIIEGKDGKPCSGFNISFEAEHYVGKSTRADLDGWFRVNISTGFYTVRVFSLTGKEVERTSIEISDGQVKRLDFSVDPYQSPPANLHGFVMDQKGHVLEGVLVTLESDDRMDLKSMKTDRGGAFSLTVPSGIFNLSLLINGRTYNNSQISLDPYEIRAMNITTNAKKSGSILTMDDIYRFIGVNWISIILLLVFILLLSISFIVVDRMLRFVKKKKAKDKPVEWFKPLNLFIRRSFLIAFASILMWQISLMSRWINDHVWTWGADIVLPAFGIAFVLLIARIGVLISDNLWNNLNNKLDMDGKTSLPKQIIALFTLVTRYIIVIMAIILILLLVLAALGLSNRIIQTLGDFFSGNVTRLVFLAVLVVVAVLSKKFIDIFFKEIGTRSSKLSPTMVQISHKGTLAGIYFVLGLIFVFTLLSIAGLGEIGMTLILVVSMIVGLVVSFAATGSIGNLLSGLVIISMKPFDTGDRIGLGETVLDIVSIGVMFTHVRDLDSRVREIPNNKILDEHIMNYSRSAKTGGFAIVVDVTLGYDIPPKKVRSLMKRAASSTKGILENPPPHVIAVAFHDHAVEYRLRAYSNDFRNMLFIKSAVMENMMDIFHSEGLEILSPLFHVKREGQFPSSEELFGRTMLNIQKETSIEGLSMLDRVERSSEHPSPLMGDDKS